jgi:hypothetical protein
MMKEHVTVVGALHIGFGILGLLLAIIIFVAVVGGGLLSGDQQAIAITAIVGTVIAGFFAILALPGIIGGVGLLRYKPWARFLVLILSVINLFNVPIGTAVGVYSIWVLIQPETIELFDAQSVR